MTIEELQKQINDVEGPLEIKPEGEIRLRPQTENKTYIGRQYVKGYICIEKSGITINGSNAHIRVDIDNCTNGDHCLFYISPKARNIKISDLNLEIYINNPRNSSRFFAAIYNTAFGLQLYNCNIKIHSEKQMNLAALYNDGNEAETPLTTRADNLSISGGTFQVECFADEFTKESSVYGVYNYHANSISIHNVNFYIVNRGNGALQKAVGCYTNGRFGRFIGNNIKANCMHSAGKEKEQAHAVGVINEGLHTIFAANNIVGEWAGKSIAMHNCGKYAEIYGNKILATHVIHGIGVLNTANECIVENNVIVSTSRNARLIVQQASNCIIGRNILEVFQDKNECCSGCGIYAVEQGISGNIVTENMIKNVSDVGIFSASEAGAFERNRIIDCGIPTAGLENRCIADRLNEKRICSLIE